MRKNACTIWKYSAGILSITAAGPDFTVAMIDSEYLGKGKRIRGTCGGIYHLHQRNRHLKEGQTIYPVGKYLGKKEIPYDDGLHVFYINAEVDDGSEAAALMKYFKTADPDDKSQGALSDRVHFLKCEEGGMKIMCEIAEKIFAEGREKEEKKEEKRGGFSVKQKKRRKQSLICLQKVLGLT